MSQEGFTMEHRALGRVASWTVFSLVVIYAVTLIFGFLSRKSPQDQIGDPYFTIMELLIILMMPFMVMSMIAVHAYATPDAKAYSFTALAFMIVMAVITSGLHFVILTVSRQIEAAGLTLAPLFFPMAVCGICIGYSGVGLVFCSLDIVRDSCFQRRWA